MDLNPLTPTLSHSKSDISDFDQFNMPNSGKPELAGRGGSLSDAVADRSNLIKL